MHVGIGQVPIANNFIFKHLLLDGRGSIFFANVFNCKIAKLQNKIFTKSF